MKGIIGCRTITYLWFANDIDALAQIEQGLEALVENIDKARSRFQMEISSEKTKPMTNSASGIQREIKVEGLKGDMLQALWRNCLRRMLKTGGSL